MVRWLLILAVGCVASKAPAATPVPPGGPAQDAAHATRMPVPPAPVSAPAWLVTGRLMSIDRDAGTARIRHPRLPIGVAAGTSTFRVAEPLFLEQMRSARNVRFSAARIDGVPTITHLEVPRR